MNKLYVLKKILAVIQGSLPASDKPFNDNYNQVNSEAAYSVSDTSDTSDGEEVKGLSRDFAEALTNRDYECLDGRAEYRYYTVDHLIELIKNDDEQNTIKFFKENKIKSKYQGCEFLSITFSADQVQAVVAYNVRTCLLNAGDKYFKELNKNTGKKNKISRGTPFITTYTLLVKKENGTWKIDKFEASTELH